MTLPPTGSLQKRELLLFEISSPGTVGMSLPGTEVPDAGNAGIEEHLLRKEIVDFPELSEVDVVRHFTRLSRWNYAIDLGLFPLGSCTMKYNPRFNENAARLPGLAMSHPAADSGDCQGSLALMFELEQMLCSITGMAAVTLQPPAGAAGELTGVMMMRALLQERGDPRVVILIPDSAHGTNPASARLSGYQVETIISNAEGRMDLDALQARMGEDVAGVMLTNPNTLGIFENRIEEICRTVHGGGGLVYMDGANMNALVGVHRPGDVGVDVMHLNLHKTFSTPHGGGGPGSGAVAVAAELEPFLPGPRVVREGKSFNLDEERPRSIGRVATFHGQFGMMIRAYAYILSLGASGLRRNTELAVVHANYLRKRLEGTYHLPYSTPTLHEVVFSDSKLQEHGVSTMDLAKRLMDYDFHAPTIYFPLVVKGAIMIEPTETEGRRELDRFVDAMEAIAREAREEPELVRNAPISMPVGRLDEAAAARRPVLRWRSEAD
ncbi:MAG: aminomethyl-transferring glycine dehydrogenase subunit GcvPB [Planctomycetota bacterium]